MSNDPDYLPGEPQPAGDVPPEPPGLFVQDMHTLATQLWAGWAPGIDPHRVRVYASAYPEQLVASITPRNARAMAETLMMLADLVEKL